MKTAVPKIIRYPQIKNGIRPSSLHQITNFPFLFIFISAVLFGAAVPACKLLLNTFRPFQLAGLIYLGIAVGILPLIIREHTLVKPGRPALKTDRKLFGMIIFGSIVSPVLFLEGLQHASAVSTSLWLNLEVVAALFIGYFIFKNRISVYGWIATAGILIASTFLAAVEGHDGVAALGFIFSACVLWGLDKHLIMLVQELTPAQINFWKGTIAGSVNLFIGFLSEPYTASIYMTSAAIMVGIFSYGVSFFLYVISAQGLNYKSGQIIFSISPFLGVFIAAALLGESISLTQFSASLIVIVSFLFLFRVQGLHLRQNHPEGVAHEHWHCHNDGCHGYPFPGAPQGEYHTHWHEHESSEHIHSQRS
ncbi:MAG: EamA family transporter [Deltaproteobacteria bacterium]|nr:EamA family transporter [Deltaproteobacteria bacterium]